MESDSVVEGIVYFAVREKADLVLMYTHNRIGLAQIEDIPLPLNAWAQRRSCGQGKDGMSAGVKSLGEGYLYDHIIDIMNNT